MQTEQECCCYQDLWREHNEQQERRRHVNEEEEKGFDEHVEPMNNNVSDIFFQLANAPLVSYRLPSPIRDINDISNGGNGGGKQKKVEIVVIEQDVEGAAQKHTGGIVWETAYLLLEYLIHQMQGLFETENMNSSCNKHRPNLFSFLQKKLPMGMIDDDNDNYTNDASRTRTILELGAGCGMLGLTLHTALGMILDTCNTTKTGIWPWRVILTETNEVMPNLEGNYHRNYLISQEEISSATLVLSPPLSVSICELDWTKYREHCRDADIKAHSVDLLLGTDVVFCTRLVEPLLQTMAYLCHDATVVILCLQERCLDSHALLLDKANDYGFAIKDITVQVLEECESCWFGQDLDCKLLQFTTSASKTRTKSSNKKRRNKDTSKIKSRDKNPKLLVLNDNHLLNEKY
jgi:hypothetical protein